MENRFASTPNLKNSGIIRQFPHLARVVPTSDQPRFKVRREMWSETLPHSDPDSKFKSNNNLFSTSGRKHFASISKNNLAEKNFGTPKFMQEKRQSIKFPALEMRDSPNRVEKTPVNTDTSKSSPRLVNDFTVKRPEEKPNTQKYSTLKISYSFKTRIGRVGGRPKKFNQDSYLCCENFSGHSEQYLFGVFDGHGAFGHTVSSFVKRTLPTHIASFIPPSRKIYSS